MAVWSQGWIGRFSLAWLRQQHPSYDWNETAALIDVLRHCVYREKDLVGTIRWAHDRSSFEMTSRLDLG
jgi:hypothetical protein